MTVTVKIWLIHDKQQQPPGIIYSFPDARIAYERNKFNPSGTLNTTCTDRRKLFENSRHAAPKFGIIFLQGRYFLRVHTVGIGVYGNLIEIVCTSAL